MTDPSDGTIDASELPPDVNHGLATLAADLVRIPSENPPGNERACATVVRDWLRERDVDAELIETPDPERPQVAARVGSGDPVLVLNGHLDVVPVEAHDKWEQNPYAGSINDGRLYGRGSADMKTGVAIAMLLTAKLAPELDAGALPGSVVFHAAMGEETADPGTETLLERGYGGTFGIVLEPTEFRVATAAKGVAVYRVTVNGDGAHASHPEQGTNPVDGIRGVLNAVGNYDLRLRDRSEGLCGTPIASVTELDVGVGTNYGVIPERGRLLIDRRIVPGEAIGDVDNEITRLLDEVESKSDTAIEWERIQHYAAASIPTDHPVAGRLRTISESRVDAPKKPWCIEAATDVRNFVNDAGISAVTWGPGSLDRAHAIDESIDLVDAHKGLGILETFTREFLQRRITLDGSSAEEYQA